jgi:hypothetical protein
MTTAGHKAAKMKHPMRAVLMLFASRRVVEHNVKRRINSPMMKYTVIS